MEVLKNIKKHLQNKLINLFVEKFKIKEDFQTFQSVSGPIKRLFFKKQV